MELSVERLVDGMQETLEEEGFVLYSKSPRDKLSLLLMFHPDQERFVFIVFSNDSLGECERVDAFVNAAVAKAAALGPQEGQQKDGDIWPRDSRQCT